MSASKAAEASVHIDKAEKYLKTSLFKRKPDVDGAIEEFTKAAVCYRNARMKLEAANMYVKIGDLHLEAGSLYHGGKSFEQAALILKDTNEFERMGDLIGRAGQLFRENGNPDSASITYEKGAKAMEQSLPERAAQFYLKSADAAEVEDKFRQAAEMSGQAARMWVRVRKWSEAVAALELKIRLCMREGASDVAGKAVTALMLVQLTREDFVAARQVYDEAIAKYGLGGTDEASPLAQLLQAYDEQDPDAGGRVLKGSAFKYLENEYAKLARDLVIPGTPGDHQGDTEKDEGNEFEGGLC